MNRKAICLLSGGLDSLIAIGLIKSQGIECIGINFTSPFFSNKMSEDAKKQFDFEYKEIKVGEDYLDMLKNPPHGYGSAINPCIDCKIYMMSKVKDMLTTLDASFVVSGEVLGQRPMSQHRKAMDLIEKKSGLTGLLIRPLCAKHLPPTLPEIEGIVDREKLLSISGRTRTTQIEIAKQLQVKDFTSPAGGCLLTEKYYGVKFRDFLEFYPDAKIADFEIIKYGRHFKFNNNKIISGRNDFENHKLLELKKDDDLYFSVPNYGSPLTILKGEKTEESIKFAAQITALYSDCKDESIEVEYGDSNTKITVQKIDRKDCDKYNLAV